MLCLRPSSIDNSLAGVHAKCLCIAQSVQNLQRAWPALNVEAIGHGGEVRHAAGVIGENTGSIHTGLEVPCIVGGGTVQKGGLDRPGDTWVVFG